MKTLSQTDASALDNLAFALMARLHVVLRRQTGRVIDIEYMRINPEYCRYILALASDIPNADLQNLGKNLSEVFFGEQDLFAARPAQPLFAQLSQKIQQQNQPGVAVRAQALPGAPGNQSSQARVAAEEEFNQSYVGRLR